MLVYQYVSKGSWHRWWDHYATGNYWDHVGQVPKETEPVEFDDLPPLEQYKLCGHCFPIKKDK